jgi:hypothetical protein
MPKRTPSREAIKPPDRETAFSKRNARVRDPKQSAAFAMQAGVSWSGNSDFLVTEFETMRNPAGLAQRVREVWQSCQRRYDAGITAVGLGEGGRSDWQL